MPDSAPLAPASESTDAARSQLEAAGAGTRAAEPRCLQCGYAEGGAL